MKMIHIKKKQQTAVEWLEEQYIKHSGNLLEMKKSFEQAKQMEKEQIIKAHCFGQILENEHDYIGMNEEINAEIYYDKKFKILTIKVTSTKW